MSPIVYCRVCKEELTGVIERVLVREGIFVIVVSQETSDCNWRECEGCKSIICKRCYAVQPLYCCSVDRVIASERGEPVGAKANPMPWLIEKSRAALRQARRLIDSRNHNKNPNQRR